MSSKRKVVIIDGHPYAKSYCASIGAHIFAKAQVEGDEVSILTLRDLQFDPIMRFGYREIQELEPDLVHAQKLMKDADHFVIISPIWWGGMTALLKGFFDRTLLPGYAFKYRQNSSLWDKFFTGKTAHSIVTSDGPTYWLRWITGDAAIKMLNNNILKFVGVKPIRTSRIDNVRWLSDQQRIAKMQKLKV